jgi:hypothetical protein
MQVNSMWMAGGRRARRVPGLGFAALLLALGTLAPAANAQSVLALTRLTNIGEFYTPGGTVDITVSLILSTEGQLTALGLEEEVPPGWTYAGTVGTGANPQIQPLVGAGGLLEFAWFPLPGAFPVTFTYRLNIPGDAAGTKLLRGEGIARVLGEDEIRSPLTFTGLPAEGGGGSHDADQNGDRLIGLGELLRVIQFYNSGGLHCADPPGTTEDGYVPGPGANLACAAHSSDYNPQNWAIALTELLRLIQFYNAPGYRDCAVEGTEDGYCPGLE